MKKVSHKAHKNCLSVASKLPASPQNMLMDVEFGQDFVGEHKRAADAVQTRVKSSAQRYGVMCDEE